MSAVFSGYNRSRTASLPVSLKIPKMGFSQEKTGTVFLAINYSRSSLSIDPSVQVKPSENHMNKIMLRQHPRLRSLCGLGRSKGINIQNSKFNVTDRHPFFPDFLSTQSMVQVIGGKIV